MERTAAILIYDVGKTNKKVLLFDEQYRLLFEESKKFGEISDEDGFPCEDILALTDWVRQTFDRLQENEIFDIRAVNFSAYGASFVYLDEDLTIVSPLYNYLKPFPPELQKKFYSTYGGQSLFSKQTASPVLGSLNSGMQIYRLKYEKPELFAKIKYALHLPQYLSFILTSKLYTDITSIGCHTNLWNYQENNYHRWVKQEGISEKFPQLLPCDGLAGKVNGIIPAGAGLHDSSAALIPYFNSFKEPFVLLATGTWCITLNPFNNTMLSDYELDEDCLCYLSYKGKPVKASRLFAGYEHEQQVRKIAEYFNKPVDHYSTVQCDHGILNGLKKKGQVERVSDAGRQSAFQSRELSGFISYEEAYHQLIADILKQQVRSTNLVLKGVSVKRIFVDGGFSRNPVFMYLLANAYPHIAVYAASVPQASALGAALAIHRHWNTRSLPSDIVNLKRYPVPDEAKV